MWRNARTSFAGRPERRAERLGRGEVVSAPGGGAPLVTVVIPMLNEARYIGACVDSVRASDLPPEQVEVLVVDGGSSDGSREIVQSRASSQAGLRLLENPRRSPAAAMNVGIKAARGKYIVRLDAHSECSPSYLRHCIDELERTGAANVGGAIAVRAAPGYLPQALALTIQHPFGVGNSRFRLGGSGFVDTVPFGAFRREVFERFGLFREDLHTHEDFEFNARLRAAGEKVYLSPLLTNEYHHVNTVREYLAKAWRYGDWSAESWRVAPHSFALRHAVPALFVLALVGGTIAATRGHLLYLLAVLGLYLAAATMAALQLAWRGGGWRYVPALPLLFLARHVVYGLGTLVGLVRPPGRRM